MTPTALSPVSTKLKNRRFMIRRRKAARKRDLTRAAFAFLRCLLLVLATATAVLGGMIAYQKLLQCPQFTVKKISVAGCGRYLPDQVMSMAGITHETNLLAIDLTGMCHRLEQSPWIERAQVKRSFPDRLSISIRERKPVALINMDGLYLVDEKGTIFKKAEGEEMLGEDRMVLPILTGVRREDAAGHPQAVAPLISQALTFIHSAEREGIPRSSISEIHLDPVLGLTVFTTPDAVQIEMGFQPFETKCRRLCAIVEDLKNRNLVPRVIDLTYRHKAFIKLNRSNPNRKAIRSGGEPPWEKMEI
jgi:cell division protein FtsQ